MYREKLESDWISWEEDSEKTWRGLTSIFQADLLHGDGLQQSKKNQKWQLKKKTNSRKKDNLISKITTLWKSNIQFSTKDHKAYEAWGNYGHLKTKNTKSTKIIPKKHLMADILDKNIKATV